ncbi:hypothetical protein G4B88_014060 [Cannabis sativa]|uniref:FAD/NAD(P)-binding domain-containing protein n=1 Tax=Cannabis sativa TaxID=3483 RepID=A0A7J6I2A1_CANSA|nr:hypothetical protein G4B88_014060 [Cannabis sativa]
MEKSGTEMRRVVVVGGGVAGSIVAQSLQFCADVVLIDQKEYFEIAWGTSRAMVMPSFAERIVINHSDYLRNVKIVASTAVDVTDTQVSTADGQSLPYDYLVIATGHKDFFPKTREERLGQYEAEYEKIKSANSILIVGGGPTGVELAGEIVYDFPEKKVTMVHSGARLLEFVDSKASQKALDWLISKNVEVLLGQSVNVDGVSDGHFQTSKGETIKADRHYVCTGKPVGSSWLTETVLKDSLGIHGRLMVDEHLRVRGHKNVFGIGDITDVKERKHRYIAQKHAQVAVKNLKVLLVGGKESKMAKYKNFLEATLVSLGRKEGVAQFPFVTISGCIPGKIKSEDLFVSKTRKQLGYGIMEELLEMITWVRLGIHKKLMRYCNSLLALFDNGVQEGFIKSGAQEIIFSAPTAKKFIIKMERVGSMENSSADKKRVVIVGGGAAGSILARSIQFLAHVVLIDEKEYFEITWGMLRAMVEPPFAERMVINHSDYLSNVDIVASAATNITNGKVFTADGRSFAYDYLVIATGHKDSFPKTKAERLSYFESEFEKIKSADSILIVGGGPTGVELAGEIAVDFPEKKVTLVHRGSRLLEFVSSKASKKALDWLISKRVEVLLDQSVNLDGITDGVYKTSKGETIKADCHFLCIGKPVASSWLTETVLKDSVDTHGRLMVDEHFRVKGHLNVFAVGDITDTKEMKQGYIAEKHVHVTVKNLKVLLDGGNESKMVKYKGTFQAALVSLGRKEGVAEFPFITISGCIPGKIKSGDLFVGKTRKLLGLKP